MELTPSPPIPAWKIIHLSRYNNHSYILDLRCLKGKVTSLLTLNTALKRLGVKLEMALEDNSEQLSLYLESLDVWKG